MLNLEFPNYYLSLFILLYVFPWGATHLMWLSRKAHAREAWFVQRVTDEDAHEFRRLMALSYIPLCNLMVFVIAYLAHERQLRRARRCASSQIENLRIMIQSDDRWLAHDPTSSRLTQRYLQALSDDWGKNVHIHSSKLRQEMGLEPNYHNPAYPLRVEKDKNA